MRGGGRLAFLGGAAGAEGDTHFFIPAMAFDVTRGSPSKGKIGHNDWSSMTTWRLDDATREAVGTQIVLPTTGNIEIKLYFAMESAAAGDVSMYIQYLPLADGEDCTGTGDSTSTAISVPGTAKLLKVHTHVASIAVTAGDLLRLCVNRDGDLGGDTATGDLHFLGLRVKYV